MPREATLTLDRDRTALLLLDFQRDIIDSSPLAPPDAEAQARFADAIDSARRLLEVARRGGMTVVHVRIAFSPGYPEANPHAPLAQYFEKVGALLEGTPGVAFHDAVAPVEGEAVVTKRGIGSFAGTDLRARLEAAGVDTVLLAGLVTHFVVEGTAREAHDLGLRFVVVTDACASGTPARHEASLTNLRVLGDVASLARVLGALGE